MGFWLTDRQGQKGRNDRKQCKESGPGVYSHAAPALVMVGHWAITFQIEPPGGQPFDALLVDRANG